ncbi:MAG TPA: glutaredoxin [Candidatus Megaira endosymbiont of Nemacystus decipiens]|nr:glutaredoxin [Candidatus Megaera endosymbiont of Nemacystus decipiens]
MSFQNNIKNKGQETSLENKNILLYVKENCIYCRLAKEFLENKSLQYEIVNLSNNYDLHKKLSDKTGQTTVPYIFINDKFIGGYSDLKNYK